MHGGDRTKCVGLRPSGVAGPWARLGDPMGHASRYHCQVGEATGWKPLDRDERIKLVGFIMWGFVALTLLFILGFELFRPVAA